MGALDPRRTPATEQELLARAHAALDVTPLSVAAAEGLNAAAVARLLAGEGTPDAAERLARAFAERSLQLWALASDLTDAARRG